jgi:hypothetical protein
VLAAHHQPRFNTFYCREPYLQFGGRQEAVDPRAGLGLFGPYDVADESRRTAIRLGVIASGHLVDLTRSWIERCQSKIVPLRKKVMRDGQVTLVPMDPRVYTPFPGMKAAFQADFLLPDALVETLTVRDIAPVQKIQLFEERIKHLVGAIVARLRVLAEKASPPDVVIVALPTDIRKLVTNPTRHAHASVKQRKISPQGNLLELLTAGEPNEERQPSVFHHALKAHGMPVGIPTQLIWQGTLEGAALEDEATRAWNFWTGVYYKGGGIPWRVTRLPKGTCFVGIAFYKDKQDGTLRSCLAQAFSDQGEGLVLRSEPFRWTGRSKTPHLPSDIASDLMTKVIEEYTRHLRQAPSRVVVHKWQRYWDDERTGFESVLSEKVDSFDLVALSDRGVRFFRAGAHPPIRGSAIQFAPDNALLFTRGFVPFLGEYPGMRVPRPIEIAEHFGSAPLSQICQEILALTKMDWNSTAFAGKEPITTAFSEDVGHILLEMPSDVVPRPQYRFYM